MSPVSLFAGFGVSQWNVFDWSYSWQLFYQGLVNGIIVAGLAAGLVLVYRATRIINFAHAAIGVFAASVGGLLVDLYGWNFWVSMILVVVLGALVGGIIELTVVRRLFDRPRLILFVATLGVNQLLLFATLQLPETGVPDRYPTAFTNNWDVGPLRIRADQLSALVGTAVLLGVLFWLLQRTRFGVKVRASADNANATRLSGISTRWVSTQVWVAAGILSTLSIILFAPVTGQNSNTLFGAVSDALFLKALAAALLAYLVSFPRALVAGLAIGVADQLIVTNVDFSGASTNLVVFVVVLITLLLRNDRIFAGESEGSFFATPREKLAPEHIRKLPWIAAIPRAAVAVMFAAGVLLPLVLTTPSTINLYSRVLIYMIVAMSAVVLTGWAGQLSLGQFAFVGLGAFTTNAIVREGSAYYNEQHFFVGLLVAVAIGVVVALVIGGPALRFRGLSLAVVTFGFAIIAQGWLFKRAVFLGDGFQADVWRPTGPVDFTSPRAYYYLCLGATVVVAFVCSRYRRSGVGRSLLAVRDNEDNAAAYTVSPARTKLGAFALAGAIASLAGGLLAGLQIQFGDALFPPQESLRIVAIAVIGGVASVLGAVLGALWVVALPVLVDDTAEVRLLTSGIGLLILLMYFPGGLIQIVQAWRDNLFNWLAARSSRPEAPLPARPAVAALSSRRIEAVEGVPALSVDGLSVHFGGVRAVDSASITVDAGEVVGLIGTNGAGKSTMMNAVSGFVPSSGSIAINGKPLASLPAHRRARLGLGRAFQNAGLFPSLTVKETIQVALEARERSLLVPSMLMLPPSPGAERRKSSEADEIIAWLGLGRYADSLASELSTGTRRIVELACLLALDADVLLLDEPTAGVAQKETEAFGPLISSIQAELGAPVLVIEHDMPMVMSISDRIYCLEAGAVIAEGTPSAVRNDPSVIASYLGTDERAINRSDAD